jgi:hypothetical protein
MFPPLDDVHWLAHYRETVEALARIRARELAALTDEAVLQQIQNLTTCEPPWRPNPAWSGLVEQQEIFRRWKKSCVR